MLAVFFIIFPFCEWMHIAPWWALWRSVVIEHADPVPFCNTCFWRSCAWLILIFDLQRCQCFRMFSHLSLWITASNEFECLKNLVQTDMDSELHKNAQTICLLVTHTQRSSSHTPSRQAGLQLLSYMSGQTVQKAGRSRVHYVLCKPDLSIYDFNGQALAVWSVLDGFGWQDVVTLNYAMAATVRGEKWLKDPERRISKLWLTFFASA